jgi:phosphatidylglycerophosphatase A
VPLVTFAALALATALGAGYIPFAPGTMGSIVGLVVWALLPASAGAQAAVIVVLFVVGAWSGTVAERHFHKTDPSEVVVDEVMGMLVTLFLNPVGWKGVVVGFLLFRLFDIIKPYPARQLEHLHGGVGVMADDFMAAVYANLALRVAIVAGAALGGPFQL